MIEVNVNGFLTDPFQQLRGLRQGDPISPLLFNIAFDPLLRAIDKSPEIQGFDLSKLSHHPSTNNNSIPSPTNVSSENSGHSSTETSITTDLPPPIKVIAYADDTLVTLSKQDDFHQLQALLDRYMNASNAKLNYDKTQVLSLSGAPHPHWQSFLQDHGIQYWHDRSSPEPLMHLGYAVIVSHPSQRAAHAQKVTANIRKLCLLHSMRPLTYRGKVTIMNTLIYSKLRHMIRLFSFSQQEIHQLQQLAASFFINSNAQQLNRFSFTHLTQPRMVGGLQLLDPQTQANALQWRWLYYLLHPSQPNPVNMPSIPLLRFTLNYTLATDEFPSFHWSLLFNTCRPVILRVYGVMVNFLRAVDTINDDIHHACIYLYTPSSAPTYHHLIQHIPHSSLPTPSLNDTQLSATFAVPIYLPTTPPHYCDLNTIPLRNNVHISPSVIKSPN